VDPDVAGDALAGDAANAPGDFLDRGHQGEGEQHHPAHREAKLRPGLGVGGDTGWVVVRGPGDQAWTKRGPQAFARRLAWRTMDGNAAGEQMPGVMTWGRTAHGGPLPFLAGRAGSACGMPGRLYASVTAVMGCLASRITEGPSHEQV